MQSASPLNQLRSKHLRDLGLSAEDSNHLLEQIFYYTSQASSRENQWQLLSKHVLTKYAFHVHLFLFSLLFPNWRDHPETAIAWMPSPSIVKSANITKFMTELRISDIKYFHQWTYTHYSDFWNKIIEVLNIVFGNKPKKLCDLSAGLTAPRWLPGASLNIADSCFISHPSKTAIIYRNEKKDLQRLSYGELDHLSNRIANSLRKRGYIPGDVIGIIMPMTTITIAAYLGIIKMGGVAVTIADSFSGEEIKNRLRIAQAKMVFTQTYIHWNNKKLSLYEKIKNAYDTTDKNRISIIVSSSDDPTDPIFKDDRTNDSFLISDHVHRALQCDPMTPCHILFSSGTTSEPKAIVWNHTTPIKVASDAFFHQNIQSGDVLAWPTNLGWMMGPWLLFAAFINQASIALYNDAPKDRDFGEFIQDAQVTMLGVVPTLVAAWRKSQCMEKLNWEHIKVFSSTGECSNQEDMLYLMSLANYKPVIEYCGGTEIGGAYVSSTIIENNIPSLFSTPAMGLNFLLLDENGKPTDTGEVAIIPPSIGLSTQLCNKDHTEVYFAHMPKGPDGQLLRRHGDLLKHFSNGYYAVLGRADDTMNLGGIKISAAEIERVVVNISGIQEAAAIAVTLLDKRFDQLIIYAVTDQELDKREVLAQMQKNINLHLNPLFKIHDMMLVKELPKTASNKIMRRSLRELYNKSKG